MRLIKAISVVSVAGVIALAGLAGCSGTSSTSSAAVSPSASSASVSASSANDNSANVNTSSSTASPSSANASVSSPSASSGATPLVKVGKQTATGTVENTTMAARAKEVGYEGADFAADTGLLTLLVLDEPITVTAYKGGSDASVEVKAIKLPNDEMFRQFKDKEITIGVDKWGEAPADVTGKLYDLILDEDTDGLVLIEHPE